MSEIERRITQLHRLRGALKTKNTIFQNYVEKPIENIDLIELNNKLKNASSILEQFELIQGELEGIVPDDKIDTEYAKRIEFEEKLSSLSSKARKILIENGFNFNEGSNSDNQNQTNTENSILQGSLPNAVELPQSSGNTIKLKLPALNLPTFSDSYEQWPGFSDTFKSSVDIDSRFTDAQKLIYLRSCLTGRAVDKIESIQTTDANYQVAWKILEKSYDDPTSVINNHIKSIFDLPNCPNSSAVALGELLNKVSKHYRALEALKKPFLESFPIYAVISKLDPQTRLKWKEHIQSNNSSSMEELLEFLHNREKILETNKTYSKVDRSEKGVPRTENQSQDKSKSSYAQSNSKKHNSYFTHNRVFCHICKESHFTQNCEKLTKATLKERQEMIKNLKLCCNCLRSNHSVENCNASTCKTCGNKHHTLLHDENNTKTFQVNHASLVMPSSAQVLFSTAVVHILDEQGNPHACRAILDNGSQVHLMTEKLASKLGSKQNDVEIALGGVNQMTSNISKVTRTIVQSRLKKFSINPTFLITPIINEQTPYEAFDKTILNIPPKIHLADPELDKSSEIDILIGNEFFLSLFCAGKLKLNCDLTLQKTYLGWIIGGKTPGDIFSSNVKCNMALTLLHNKISEFWEIENGPSKNLLSEEEKACELHYKQNTQRELETGRYIVKLPFKENFAALGESYSISLKRFFSLEKSLRKNSELKTQYIAFMREYLELGHMSEDESNCTFDGYFLPHHAVLKQSSLTTKLRTVFDASAKTSNGKSLNDVLMTGPNVQDDLFSLLVRFRSYTYAITADIEKMYRQILLDSDDQKYQRILWREDSLQPVKIFKLKTVTYGTSSASFLATRTLVQLANDEASNFEYTSTVLKKDFYMDDLLSGAQTFEEVKLLINELMYVTKKAGMNLRQWASNNHSLINPLCNESTDKYLYLNLEDTTKTLGVYWNLKADSFFYKIKDLNPDAPVTKRTILSEIAQLFDSLGLLGPVILQPKMIMQSLWKLNVEWDEIIPTEVANDWLEYRGQLNLLEKIKISRKIRIDDSIALQLHGFCDASERAYGACIYLRSTDKNGTSDTRLVCSKSRVAPVKSLSLPRLELCAALLLANLYDVVSKSLRRLKIERVIFWSDSTITLHWIKCPSHILKTFVGNRVEEIETLTQSVEWRHIRTNQNPADLISRGLSPRQLTINDFWFNGPSWINDHEVNWPVSILEIIEVPELKKNELKLTVNLTHANAYTNSLFAEAQSFKTLIRIVAYCLRFINIKIRKEKVTGPLTSCELKIATTRVVKIVQHEAFSNEIRVLKTEKIIKGRLTPLSPFLDSEGILRVGGRLKQADLNFSQKHPILIPQKNNVATALIRDEHLKMLHAGTQATLSAIRESYWIINGKTAVKSVIHKCVTCCRARPPVPVYIMGDLPKNRTTLKKVFLQSEVDYCGPFYIKEKKYRNRGKIKIHVAIFVCFATKSVHIEVVSDLTTEAFLATLKRFLARRGRCSDIYSDNGSNFVGAKNEIDAVCKFLNSNDHNNAVSEYLANQHINWHFIPPRSPHFGGLWEAAVKSFKHHWIRVIGEKLLTYEEFITLAVEIECILNSRPLTPIPSDPNDLVDLTPGHFLTGDSLMGIPEQDLKDLPSGRLSSWQQVQQMKQHFWVRWNKEYLNELTVKKKWHKGFTTDIKINQIVTIRDDNLPPMRWMLGRVISVHPGTDGIICVVTLKTVNGECKRSVKKLSPLPIESM